MTDSQDLAPSPRRFQSGQITPEQLDPDALKVIHRLKGFGHEAYLVGGCVRDLLLGKTPKDFDVATSARPRQVRRFFKNCRIIGRRFKLAHIAFGRKIIETATFRKSPEQEAPPLAPELPPDSYAPLSDDEMQDSSPAEAPAEAPPVEAEAEAPENEPDLLITDDNIFGNAEEDARRRDFTINALFYDPETHEVIDYIGGYEDLESRTIRTIGAPTIRFKEDPVRIIRAVKFATRLGFSIEDGVYRAMKEVAPELTKSAPPRILEEVLRLLRSGHAAAAFRLLREVGALRVILPEIEGFLEEEERKDEEGRARALRLWRMLELLDESVQGGHTPTTALGMSCLFLPLIQRRTEGAGQGQVDLGRLGTELLAPFARRTRLSRFDFGRMQRICIAQRRFTQKPGRRFRPNRFVHQDYFPEALALFRIQSKATGLDPQVYERWESRALGSPQPQVTAASPPAEKTRDERRGRGPRHGRRPERSRQPRPGSPPKPASPHGSEEDPLLREEERDPTWGDW